MDNGTFLLDGVTLGASPFVLTRAPTGVLDTAAIRVADEPRPRRNGVVPGDDLTAGKILVFEVAVIGESAGDAEAQAVALGAAFAPRPVNVWLEARVTGTPSEYAFLGRPRGADILLDLILVQDDGSATVPARCSFFVIDPTRYSLSMSEVVITMTAEGDGLMYPVEYPLVYSAAGGVGSAVAVNTGTAAVEWVALLQGPLTNPRLEHVDSGLDVTLAATIAAGEFVVLDSATGSILLGGTAPRPLWFAPGSNWFTLAPGSNLLRLTADAGTGTATVQYRSGWT